MLAGVEVHNARVRMGERLAEEAPVDADLVMPIPDSGTPAAIGFSRALAIPFSEGLIKNRYVGRTFIQPDQGLRDQGVKLKFNPLAEVRGRRIVVVDDSIVRGSTMRQIVAMLFEAGALEVHVRVSSPPIVSPCFYGIDFADEDQLVAADRDVEGVRELVGATSLAYLSLEGLQAATRRPASNFCRACLTREYPTPVPLERRLDKTTVRACYCSSTRLAFATPRLIRYAGLVNEEEDQPFARRPRLSAIQQTSQATIKRQDPDEELRVARDGQAGHVAHAEGVGRARLAGPG